MTSPRFFQSILPRYSSLVPPVYDRAESTWISQTCIPFISTHFTSEGCERVRLSNLVVAVLLEHVQDYVHILQVVNACT